MNFSGMLSKMLVLFIFIVLGFSCGKGGIIDEHVRQKLNKLILYVCAPTLTIYSVLDSELAYSVQDIFTLMLFGFLNVIVLFIIALILVPLLREKGKERGVYLFCSTFGNCVFMGFPVIASLYGSSVIFLGSICSIPYNILLYSLGIYVVSGGKDSKGFRWRALLLNPPLIATVIAFFIFIFNIKFPLAIVDTCSYLGRMVIPLAMMLIGYSLSTVSFREIFGEYKVYFYCLFKLIIAPVVVFFVFRIFVTDPLFLSIIVVSSAMPSATIVPILCTEYGGNTILASKVVFLSTLCSLVTIPIMISLLLL